MLQRVDIHGFDHVHIKAGGSSGFPILRAPIASHRHEMHFPVPRLSA